MSGRKTRHAVAGVAAGALVAGSLVFAPAPASADLTYTLLPQSQMSVAEASSVAGNEGTNGPGALVLDGDKATYWHTLYSPAAIEPPHHLKVKLADSAVRVGRVTLTPRQSSTGSGRVNEYELLTATGADCAAADYTRVASGAFPGDVASALTDRVITLDTPVEANCLQVKYLSTWGGQQGSDPMSPVEKVGSLAELNVETVTGEVTPPAGPEIVIPEGAVELVDGDLKVRMHPGFPQVVDYRLGADQLAGRIGGALTSILVNEVEQQVNVAAPVLAADKKSATYKVSFKAEALAGVSFDAVASVEDGVFKLTFANIVDPKNDVRRIRIPNHDLVSVTSDDAASQITGGRINVNRASTPDSFENVAATAARGVQGAYMIVANNSKLAAAFDTNATEDNRGPSTTSGRVQSGNNRYQHAIVAEGDYKKGTAYAGTWTWLAEAVVEKGGATSIGRETDPFVEVKLTKDLNADATVDWQDGAIATRDIMLQANGADKVPNQVIARIPFNIVSQATHPFLRTLDDSKRISLATDNLGQKALLKGYQAEGHDAAHPDYAGNYNIRAGGLQDLKTLADEGENWNTTFGVHVNATESYSEANAFSEDLLQMPPKAAWGWMNQSYYIDGPKDLATGNVLKRFQNFMDEAPDNLRWLYMDVYYPYGWEQERFTEELHDQGWTMSTEWSDHMPQQSTWSHWSQEEAYGGSTNKGLNSQLMRFIYNTTRDTWNPDPVLGNTNLVDFEGWTGHVNYNAFINNVWQRNLPTKFLQQSEIVKWDKAGGRIEFENGTVATSPLQSINGTTVPTNRKFVYDGATVYDQGKYLLPWKDGGTDRLYHYNGAGGTSEWTLTDAWKAQTSLKLFKLTDTGRVEVGDVNVVGGKVTIQAEANVAYVLYPSSEVPAAKAPNWGQGTGIVDPGFFAGNLDAYTKAGNVSIVKTDRGNFQAEFGAAAASLKQTLTLAPGTYSGWAWVEVEPTKTRELTLTAEGAGITKAGYGTAEGNKVFNTISSSTVRNSTASDEKLRTNFQRLRVTFTTDGTPFNFGFSVGAGDAKVSIDDLRVVKNPVAVDANPTAQTVFFEDFENIDTGYFPFVTGATNVGGDARTQLALRHEPYSQKGWWGVNSANTVVEGGKLNDNVLTGNWSLMANNENTGEILKTSPGAIPFQTGHRYRVSFDYQTTYADQFVVRLGGDSVAGGVVKTTNQVADTLGEARTTTRWSGEFDSSCGAPFIAIDKLSGQNTQHNMTIDSLRVEDLGESAGVCIDGSIKANLAVQAGDAMTVTTTISAISGALTDVKHALTLPEDWTATVATAGATTLEQGAVSTQVWTVEVPLDGAGKAVIGFTGTGVSEGKTATVNRSANVTVSEPLPEGETYLSDMQDRVTSQANGWGPVEWDMSNGEQAAGDGGPIKVDGVTHPKGIGMHANGHVTFDLGGKCTAFSSVVGIDDRQAAGSVTFIVYGDDKELARSAELTGSSKAFEFNLDITGVKSLKLVADQGAGNGNDWADWASARVTCGDVVEVPDTDAPVIEQIADVSVVVGADVSVSVKATDESTPLVYSATGLPAGVSIDAATGVISGKPTAAGVSNVTVTVTDAAGNEATSAFKLTVTAAPVVDEDAPVIEKIADVSVVVGADVSVAVKATDESTPLVYSATGLPAGVSIDAATGVISGKPTAAGVSNVTVTVTDAAGNEATSAFKLTVTAAPVVDKDAPVIEKIADQAVKVGAEFKLQVKATDASKPLVYSATGLPEGLKIDAATGAISGKATKPGTSKVVVTVADAKGNKASVEFKIKVENPNKPEFVRTAPYTLAGYHDLNGREWFTKCEAYSQTERCRTEIWATVVVKTAKGYEVKQGWAFNNLTYLPLMEREQWKGNPLAFTNEWTAADGRKWKTECDTAATGSNACRSYTLTTVVGATAKPAGGYTFIQSQQWVFNNIVMFK